MERKIDQLEHVKISRREFVKISGAGSACVFFGIVPAAALAEGQVEDPFDKCRNLRVYRTENIMNVVLAEGETVCTGDPARASEKCTGCTSCMAACSLSHEGISSSDLSGIKVCHYTNEWTLREKERMLVHSICRHCPGIPPCDEICPEHAHFRSEKLGAVLIDHEKCVRCGACVDACPYHACWYSEALDKIVKCDLCHDNSDGPRCIQNCASSVLQLEKVV